MFASGFQSIAFQTVVGIGIVTATPAYNGNSTHEPYQSTSHELRQFQQESAKYADKIQEVKTEARAIEYKLDDLEFRRLRDLADEAMQMELVALLQQQQVLQQLLLDLEYKELMARRAEEDLLIIMMSMPFFG